MIDLSLSAAKGTFFNSPKVIASVDVATRQALSKMGAFVRTRARSSIRKRRKSAPPGKPPSDHGGPLKRMLFFVFDPSTHSVVVGPIVFGANKRQQVPRAPRTLEVGATVTRLVERPAAAATRKAKPARAAAYRRLLREGRIVKPPVVVKTEPARYEARPFMKPALLAEVAAGTLTDQLRGSIRG